MQEPMTRRRLPNLNQLRAFEAAARHLSFTKAAEELNITQTAVSHRIRALEEDLGQPLFRRQVRAVALTPEAERLAEAIGAALVAIAEAVEAFSGPGLTGTLRLTVAPFFGNRVVLPLLPAFHAAHPGLRIEPAMASEVVDLARSDYDGALRYGDGHWPGMTAIPISRDRLIPVAAPGLVADRDLPMAPEEIAAFPLAVTGQGDGIWRSWFTAAGLTDPPETTRLVYSTRAARADMALSGVGVALCGAGLVRLDIEAGRLVPLSEVSVPEPKRMYLVIAGTGRPDPRLAVFADWLAAELDSA